MAAEITGMIAGRRMNNSTAFLPLNSLVPKAFAVEKPTINANIVTAAEISRLVTVASIIVR
jgi:hypothetical protein